MRVDTRKNSIFVCLIGRYGSKFRIATKIFSTQIVFLLEVNEIEKLNYWKLYTNDNINYSCDMIRIRLLFDKSSRLEENKNVLGFFDTLKQYDGVLFNLVHFPCCTRLFKYRELFTFEYGNSSVSIGVGFNGAKGIQMEIGFIEFNPNKVLCDDDAAAEFAKFLSVLHRFCEFSIARWDLAIDLPCTRNNVLMLHNDTRYYEYHKEVVCTEYLGKRNHSGYTKLYDKTAESHLNYNVTRLELTCDGSWTMKEITDHLPSVCFCPSLDEIETTDLKGNDIVLVKALALLPAEQRKVLFNELTYHIRKKIESYLFITPYSLDSFVICQLQADVIDLVNTYSF